MKHTSRITLVSVVSFLTLFSVFYYLYPSHLQEVQEIVVEGWMRKPEERQEISFSGSRIYTLDIRSQGFTPISPENMDAHRPVWSPNGKLLAYMYIQNNEKSGIAVVNENKQTRYFEFPHNYSDIIFELAWSPDSQSILFFDHFQSCHQLYQLNVNNGLINSIDIFPTVCGIGIPHLAWLLDGSIIVELDREIFTLDTSTQSLRFVTTGYKPFWNPKEKWVTYICEVPSKSGHFGYTGLCEIMVDGANKHLLFQPINNLDVSWISGTKYIGFRATGGEGDLSYLAVVDMRTKERHNLYQITGIGMREIWIEGVAWHP